LLTKIHADLLDPDLALVNAAETTRKETIDVVVTSPPYKKKDGYSGLLMVALGQIVGPMLKPGGRVFINFGQLRENYFCNPFQARSEFERGSRLIAGQTIIWAKSIVVDDIQRGHFQPITMRSPTLNYCWEYVFQFYKPPEPKIDRLSIGVPYADKSNLTRGTRGSNGDLHCAGDIWFIPYETTGATKKKKHDYEYPEELVRRCLKLSGAKPGQTLLEPFCGSGTSAKVGKEFGMDAVVIDRDPAALKTAQDRWDSA
jgi:site-specific DNA-methyltransferase (adenine-specific)